jgi:hypothetical protein
MAMTLEEFQRKGGETRMKRLTKAEKTALGKKGAQVRWKGNSHQRRVARRKAKRK